MVQTAKSSTPSTMDHELPFILIRADRTHFTEYEINSTRYLSNNALYVRSFIQVYAELKRIEHIRVLSRICFFISA